MANQWVMQTQMGRTYVVYFYLNIMDLWMLFKNSAKKTHNWLHKVSKRKEAVEFFYVVHVRGIEL